MARWTCFTTLLLSVICVFFTGNDAARILGIFPTTSKSHWILGTALAKELSKAGHEVTVISPFKLQNPPVNYREIEIEYSGRAFDDAMDHIFEATENSVVSNLFQMRQFVEETTNATLTSPAVQRLLQSPNEMFDLLLLEIFMDDALLGFGDRFQCPIVGMSTFGASTFINDLTGTPQPLSYVPHQMLSYTSNMTFWQRLVNVAFHGVEAIVMRYIYLPMMQQYYDKFFPHATRSLDEMRRHSVSVVLINSHFSMSFLRPYSPNMIEVGGFHVNRVVNSLPQDIRTFIENSEHGVLYFSLGGNVKPSRMDPRKRDAMIRVLSRAQQNIIWKWDDDTLQLDERKFLVRRWLPQDDILAHPKVRLFITHGGLLSCTEAIYHGVPIVAIPIFGDQPLNAARVAHAGWGVTVAYSELDEYSFERAINEVLQEERYRLKVKQISERYRDQPLTPMQTAMFWIEYVLRHGKSAEHLRSPAQELSTFEYYNLDVYALYIGWYGIIDDLVYCLALLGSLGSTVRSA
ncbi:UDP-glycosyltransferase UGT5-like [Anopheles moucheti]|uniref:UDP-glycosyltransferase UGT5-like n=1 Tax=Anopheles moucheti TaxID=186751 RepID=UPI0022F037DE|nr:UDP-glycosyltransferase UGT5-like [Anopheles moucheti]